MTENSPIYDLLNSHPSIHSLFPPHSLDSPQETPQDDGLRSSTLLEHWFLDHFLGLISSLCDSSFILLPSETFHNLHWKMALLLKIHSVVSSPYRAKCKPQSRLSPPRRTWETFHGLVSPCSSGLMPAMALPPCPRHTCITHKPLINAKLTMLPEKPPHPHPLVLPPHPFQLSLLNPDPAPSSLSWANSYSSLIWPP